MHRLTVDLETSTYNRFITNFKHGLRGTVVRIIIDDLNNLCDQFGAGRVVGALLDYQLKLLDTAPFKEFRETGAK